MSNSTYDEAIYIAKAKRKRAKEALNAIIDKQSAHGGASEGPTCLELIVEYFSNIVYAIELVLKVLSRDWDGPEKTKNGHDVGKMYRKAFGSDYCDPGLMKTIEKAILDQKFLFQPANGLLQKAIQIEELWDNLNIGFLTKSWGSISQINKSIEAGKEFGETLIRLVDKLTPAPIYQSESMSNSDKILLREHQIKRLEGEIAALREQGDQPVVPWDQIDHEVLSSRLHQEWKDEKRRRRDTLRCAFELRGSTNVDFWFMFVRMAEDIG